MKSDHLERTSSGYHSSVKSSIESTTHYQFGLTIRNYIIPHIGNVRLKDLRLMQIEKFYGVPLTSGVGARTVNLVHAVLHRALVKAVRYGYITSNPAHGANLPKYSHSEKRVLDTSQVSQFLISAIGSPYEALYHLAIQTGMRQGELFGLQWSDLQWETGDLHVQRQIKRVPCQGWKYTDPKTKAGSRTIKLGEGMLTKLRQHKEHQDLLKQVAGERWQEHNLIFPSSVGTPGDTSNLRKDFLKVLEAAGFSKIRFHDLRHTATSIMLNNGIPPNSSIQVFGACQTQHNDRYLWAPLH